MATDESYWIERAQSAEARMKTLEDQCKPALERVKQFKANFGVKERSDGSLVVNYQRLVEALGIEGAFELRRVIDETYQISGAPGEKPKVKLTAS